jgi:hypothetical protein
VDAAELGVGDADRATDEDAALEAAGVELLLVLVLLLVAVVEARDGGVAPVDDREAVAVVEEGALADQDVALAAGPGLAQAEVAEVGVLRVDGGVAALAAGAAEGRDLMHLLDQRGLVLLLGLGEGVAQLEHLGVEVLELLGGSLRFTCEPRQDPSKDVRLFADDALAVGREASSPGQALVTRSRCIAKRRRTDQRTHAKKSTPHGVGGACLLAREPPVTRKLTEVR